jgi:magnesium transporter
VLQSPPETKVDEVMLTNVDAVHDMDDAKQAAHRFQGKSLTVLPVVDIEDKLVGVVGLEEALEVLAEEAVRNTFSIVCGRSAEESTFTPSLTAVRSRLPWMALNVFLNLGAVALITGFEETIEEVPIIAAFLPMVTDMGGNVGIQALSVAVRSIALKEASFKDICKVFRKEALVGSINGVVLAIQFGLIVLAMRRNIMLSVVVAMALASNVLVASVVGGSIPFLVKHYGLDPAMMTGPILTTITDCTGVTIYLGLTTALMSYVRGHDDEVDV